MTQKDWADFFLRVLKQAARDRIKSKEARLNLCRFFHGLLGECLEWAKIEPKEIGTSVEMLERLAKGKVSLPRRKKAKKEVAP